MKKTLENKVDQMLMGGFNGLLVPSYFLEWLHESRLGGVILFARNVANPQQLSELTQQLQSTAKYPLLVGNLTARELSEMGQRLGNVFSEWSAFHTGFRSQHKRFMVRPDGRD